VPGQRGEIARRRGIRAFDTLPHPSPFTMTELRQTRLDPVPSGRQDVHLHVVRQRRHLLVEPVPAGDLERDQPHLPRPGGDRQRALDAAHLQHVDGARAQRDGSPDRDRIHQAAVEVMGAVDLDRRQQPGHRARGQHRRHDRAAAEPACARGLDAGGDALERQLQVREVTPGQRVSQRAPQRLEGVQVRARAHQPGRATPDPLAERQPQLVALPHPAQPRRGAHRVGRHERPVDGAYRGAHHQIGPDAGFR
jgi:hypothetical protein